MKAQDRYKFRGVSVGDLAPMVYGYYHYDASTDEHFICDAVTLKRYQVRPETVGRYAGINGLDIWEGDKLKCDHFTDMYGKKHYLHHSVHWMDEYQTFYTIAEGNPIEGKTSGNCPLWVYMKNSHKVKVTGNIHQ